MEDARTAAMGPAFSSLAIFSLVFAIFAWTILPFMGLAMIRWNVFNVIAMPLSGSVLASVCARVAQRRIQQSDGLLRGAGIAKAAGIMAYAQYALIGLLALFIVLQGPFLQPHVFYRFIPDSH